MGLLTPIVWLLCVSQCWGAVTPPRAPVLFGEVLSPGYPGPYPASVKLQWELEVPQGYNLLLSFTHLDIEPSQHCHYDSLMVLYGRKILGKFCGQENSADGHHPGNRPILSPGNSLRLVFQSDSSNQGPDQNLGFRAFYRALDIDECSLEVTEGEEPLCQHLCHNTLGGYLCSCHHGYELQPDKSTCKLQCVGGLFTELGGQLSSPGYPLPSPPGLSCHYNITVDPGFLISLHFTGLFHIEQHHALCPHHWLKVSVPGQEDVSLCGSEAPGMMSTGSYSVQLEYHTDQEGQSRGWTLHYSTERVQCPSPSGITNGRVSPDFPEYRFRDYITIRCDTGYKMMMGKQEIDSYFTVCQSDGQWHLPLPECHIIDCGPPSTLLNGEFLFLSGSQNQYRSLIQYRCNEPFYKLPTKGDVKYSCSAERKWKDDKNNYILPTCFPVCGQPTVSPTKTQRILGGQDAVQGAFPWQVLLITLWGRAGGALVGDRWVLTAAHNIYPKAGTKLPLSKLRDSIEVYAGDNSVEKILSLGRLELEDVIPHPSFDQSSVSFDNDIALLKLRQPVTVNSTIMPLCLPPEGAEYTVDKAGYASGWGITEEYMITNKLRFISLPVVDQDKCRISIDKQRGNRKGISELTDNMFCAGLPEGGGDTCQGDSGGAFVLRDGAGERYYAAGVVSWGINCGETGSYGVYTRVGNYRAWLRETMGEG
ncbi:complement component 1, r subcomponent [Amia ocellicauda]|uniref:complement component 1, r subcomponent n=1 Tax=Amia ocellicauda TaxID=2972642 RepID=UPI00346481B0